MDMKSIKNLGDAAFEQVVSRNIHLKTCDLDEWEALCSPELIERTHEALKKVYTRISNTIQTKTVKHQRFKVECFQREEGKKEWPVAKAEFEEWRVRAGHYQNAVQARLGELNQVRRARNRAQNERTSEKHRWVVRQLALAVRKHQAAHARQGGVAEQCDYELWGVLDELRVPTGSGGSASLRSMLDVFWSEVAPVSDAQEQQEEAERTLHSAPGGRSATYEGTPRARHVQGKGTLS